MTLSRGTCFSQQLWHWASGLGAHEHTALGDPSACELFANCKRNLHFTQRDIMRGWCWSEWEAPWSCRRRYITHAEYASTLKGNKFTNESQLTVANTDCARLGIKIATPGCQCATIHIALGVAFLLEILYCLFLNYEFVCAACKYARNFLSYSLLLFYFILMHGRKTYALFFLSLLQPKVFHLVTRPPLFSEKW